MRGPAPAVHFRAVADDVVVEVIGEAGHASGRVMLIDGLPASQADLDDPERVLFDYHLHLALLAAGLTATTRFCAASPSPRRRGG